MNLILVIGKNGQLASSLRTHANKENYKLIFLGREAIDLNSINKDILERFLGKFKPSLIINAAGYTNVEEAELNSEIAFQVNGYATGLIATYCRKKSIPLIHISSDYVFGNDSSELLNPEQKTNPIGVYAKSKALGEELIKKSYNNFEKDFLIIRVSWVFDINGENFINKILKLAKNQQVIKVVCDQYGGPTSSSSIAKSILKIVENIIENKHPIEKNYSFPWGIYHFQGKPIISWYEFAKIILNKSYEHGIIEKIPLIIPISSSELKSNVARPKNSRLNCFKSEKDLGLKMPCWEEDLDYFFKLKKKESLKKKNQGTF